VIDQELEELVRDPRSAPVAYFYCSRSHAEPQLADPEEILRSIARQLSGINEDLPVREPAMHKYEGQAKAAFGTRRLTLDEAVQLILELLNDNPATIIIDALDECDPNRRHELFESLEEIVQKSVNIVKIFVSSRNDGDIICRLADSPNIYIDAQQNEEDIERFIFMEVEKAIYLKRILGGHVSQELKHVIIDTLNKGAQGM
jgi:hypothetical protein